MFVPLFIPCYTFKQKIFKTKENLLLITFQRNKDFSYFAYMDTRLIGLFTVYIVLFNIHVILRIWIGADIMNSNR